jgi:electron transport complex protein RnfG
LLALPEEISGNYARSQEKRPSQNILYLNFIIKEMKKAIHMFLVLTIVAGISGFFLSLIYNHVQPIINKKKEKEIKEAILMLIPDMKEYKQKQIDKYKIFYCYNKDTFLGYCILAKGGGYQGEIKILIAVSPDKEKILGIKILESVETPGLGARINEDWFQKQFRNKLVKIGVKLVKRKPEEKNEVQAITGATISSSSVVRIVNNICKKILPKLK